MSNSTNDSLERLPAFSLFSDESPHNTMNPDPLEKDIEKKVVAYAKSKGCIVYKFTSPSKRSVPDRLFITPKGVVFFAELKRRGHKPTPSQEVEIAKIRSTGVSVFVVDNVALGKAMVDGMMRDVSLEDF